ncbi:ABC transporter permease subunit [Candidatus Sumerlaeota bacterium]|nr:ABC transporter permease subunit [Candidatus Sumerlaeota bacterium]
MRAIWLIAKSTILETLRRKDIYVVLILAVVIIGTAGMFNFFGIHGLQKFLKDISLSVINILVIIIAIVITARQLPAEFEQRTIYPMLAKPIGRIHFLLGKFLGVLIMSVFTLCSFGIIFLIVLAIAGASTGWIALQAFYARFLSLCVICSLTLCLSLFLTHSANVTVMLLFCLGASMFSRTIILVHNKVDIFTRHILELLYFILPHLDLFDMSKLVVHNWAPRPLWVLGALTLYGGFYTFIFLTIAHLRFKRRML